MDVKPGFYQHFKGKMYLVHGVGTYGIADLGAGDTLFATGMYHEYREGDEVNIFKRDDGSLLIQGNQKPGTKVVIYQKLYGEGPFCVREVESFLGNKNFLDGKQEKRFKFIGFQIPNQLKNR